MSLQCLQSIGTYDCGLTIKQKSYYPCVTCDPWAMLVKNVFEIMFAKNHLYQSKHNIFSFDLWKQKLNFELN